MELTAFSLILTGVVFEVLGQLAFKRGAAGVVRVSGEQGVLRYWRDLGLDRWIQLGVAVHVVALLFWVAALSFVPLSIAFPLASLSYCGAAIGAHYWLGEKIGRHSIAAIALITIGAALVCWPRG
jgi:undecaprenyl phosphate-alpha-L-ara4N flippase subunit ArnE